MVVVVVVVVCTLYFLLVAVRLDPSHMYVHVVAMLSKYTSSPILYTWPLREFDAKA